MKKTLLRAMVVGSLAAAAMGIGPRPASAETMTEDGCVEWNSTGGCVVRQYCTLNTDTRSWSCIYHDTRTDTMRERSGTY